MLKSELIAALQEIDGDPIVLVASDEEGNHVNMLFTVEDSKAVQDGYEWDTLHPDDYEEYEDDSVDVIVLWP